MSDAFGPLLSLGDVEEAVLTLLREPPPGGSAPLIVYYLAERERNIGLPKRTFDPPDTYRGGTDFTAYAAETLPAIIVVAQPTGRPERYDVGTYAQWFQVQVGAIVKDDDETDARILADAYGSAIAGVIAHNGGLGPSRISPGERFAIKTDLTEFPTIEFAVNATTSRNVLRSTVTFQTCVQPVLGETGPQSFPRDPYQPPAAVPTVESYDVQLSELT